MQFFLTDKAKKDAKKLPEATETLFFSVGFTACRRRKCFCPMMCGDFVPSMRFLFRDVSLVRKRGDGTGCFPRLFAPDFLRKVSGGVSVYLCRKDAVFGIFMQCRACVSARNSVAAQCFSRSEKALKNRVFDERKTPLRCLPDAIMMLTFFDAVVIAIRTCCYRDDNMMLSTCVHVVIKLAICC